MRTINLKHKDCPPIQKGLHEKGILKLRNGKKDIFASNSIRYAKLTLS